MSELSLEEVKLSMRPLTIVLDCPMGLIFFYRIVIYLFIEPKRLLAPDFFNLVKPRLKDAIYFFPFFMALFASFSLFS